MESIGIIAEYNPFHNGHRYHLEETKKITKNENIICIMSGNFTQRGDLAIINKWDRASMAVKAGVSLVIELPVVFTIRSAQYFATGAIRLLKALGLVTGLCFGAENANNQLLSQIAKSTTNPVVLKLFHENIDRGNSYAAAMGCAISSVYGIDSKLLNSPNNILAIEYIRAIHYYQANITPIPIYRIISNYHDTKITHSIASATSIRHELQLSNINNQVLQATLPEFSFNILKTTLSSNKELPHLNNLSAILLYKLRTMKAGEIRNIPGISEGLENRLLNNAKKAIDLETLLNLTKSKRYPLSRLQRILLHILLAISNEDISKFDETGPLYARILAFNDQGRTLIKQLKKTSSIPLITKTTDYLNTTKRDNNNLTDLESMLSIDTYATDIYALAHSPFCPGGLDFIRSPLYIK